MVVKGNVPTAIPRHIDNEHTVSGCSPSVIVALAACFNGSGGLAESFDNLGVACATNGVGNLKRIVCSGCTVVGDGENYGREGAVAFQKNAFTVVDGEVHTAESVLAKVKRFTCGNRYGSGCCGICFIPNKVNENGVFGAIAFGGDFRQLNREFGRVCSKLILGFAGIAVESYLYGVVILIDLDDCNTLCIGCYGESAQVANAKLNGGTCQRSVVFVYYGYLIGNGRIFGSSSVGSSYFRSSYFGGGYLGSSYFRSSCFGSGCCGIALRTLLNARTGDEQYADQNAKDHN